MTQTIEYRTFLCNKKSIKNNKVPYNYFSYLFRKYDQRNKPISISDINNNIIINDYSNTKFTNENFLLVTAVEDKKVVGFCVTEIPKKEKEGIGYINFIETFPTYRFQGIATNLLNITFDILIEKGINKCNLTCLSQEYDFWSSKGAILNIPSEIKTINKTTVFQMQFRDLPALVDKTKKLVKKRGKNEIN